MNEEASCDVVGFCSGANCPLFHWCMAVLHEDGIKVKSLNEDYKAEVEILDVISENDVASMLDCENYVYGILKNGTLIGYCTLGGADVIENDIRCQDLSNDLLLSDVFICPSFRGNGYGTKLVSEAIRMKESEDILKDQAVFAQLLDDDLFQFYFRIGFNWWGGSQEEANGMIYLWS